jgi:hypothetical protein
MIAESKKIDAKDLTSEDKMKLKDAESLAA